MPQVHVLSFTLEDIEGNRKNVPVHMPPAATMTDIITFALSAAGHLDATSSARVVAATISYDVDLSTASPAPKGAPLANSRVGSGATLSFRNTADVAYSQYIPAVLDALLENGVVLNTGAMNTWISDMLNGGASADPSDLNGLDLETYVGGKQANRK